MVQPAIYCLAGAGDTKIAISQDELRALFGQVETEFCQSDIYKKAVRGLQKRLGDTSTGVNLLIKALGREAIRLALRQVVRNYHTTDHHALNHSGLGSLTFEDASQDSVIPNTAADLNSFEDKLPQPASQTAALMPPPPPRAAVAVQEPAFTASVPEPLPEASKTPLNPSPALRTLSASQSSSTPIVQIASVADAEESVVAPRLTSGLQQQTPRSPSAAIARPASPATAIQEARQSALKQIGQELQQARVNQSISVYEIHQRTHIPLHQIQALELGQSEYLPEDIYVRGFIRRITEALSLDGTSLLNALPLPPSESTIIPTWNLAKSSPPPKNDYLRPAHLYLGYATLMAGAAGGLVWIAQGAPAGIGAVLDASDVFQDANPVQWFEYSLEHSKQVLLQRRIQPIHSGETGAIAQPERIPVESSASKGSVRPNPQGTFHSR